MKLTETLMSMKAGNLFETEKTYLGTGKQEQKEKEGFGSYLQKSNDRIKERDLERRQSKITKPIQNGRTNNLQSKENRFAKVANDSENTSEPESKGNDVKVDTKSKDIVKAEQSNPDEGSKTGNEIIEKISKTLDIPVDTISKILADLNITPLDLLNKETLSNFIQSAYNLESRMDLLNIPNAKEVFNNLTEIIKQFENSIKQEETGKAVFVNNTDDLIQSNLNPQSTVVSGEIKNKEAYQTIVETEVTEGINETGDLVKLVAPNKENFQNSNGAGGQGMEQSQKEMLLDHNSISEDSESINFLKTSTSDNTNFVETVKKTEATKNINTDDVVKQIVEKLKVEIKGNVSEVKMILRPESLGEVSLKISTQNGIVTAQFIAENQRVKEIIEANFNQLKETLQAKGLEVSQLSVSVNTGDSNDSMAHFEREQKKSQRRLRQILNGAAENEDVMIEEEDFLDNTVVLGNNVNYKA